MEFLEPSEKIVTLRKKLGLKQYDFETDNFTRGYLGLIESKRRKLTKAASDIIIKRFREVIAEKNLDIELDDDYFMRTPKEDATKFCTELLEKESHATEEEINNILIICDAFNLTDLKAQAYILKGRKKVSCSNHDEAYINFIKAANCTTNTTDLEIKGRIYNNLGICRATQLDYKGALEYFKIAKAAYESMQLKESLNTTIYNIAMCYYKDGNYVKALENIDNSLSFINKKVEFTKYVFRMDMKALCHKELKEYEKVISIYNQLLDYIKYIHNDDNCDLKSIDKRLTVEEKDELANVYNNLGNVYTEIKELQKALDYYKEAERIRTQINSPKLSHVLVEEAKLYLIKGTKETLEEAFKYATLSLEYAEKSDDYEYIINSYAILIQYYTMINANDKVIEMEEQLLQIYIPLGNYKKAIETNNRLISKYTETNEIDKIKQCNKNIDEYLKYI